MGDLHITIYIAKP